MEGLYVSFNEEQNGPIEEPIRISNDEYLIFQHRSPCKRQLYFPTKILIKVSKKKEYYEGSLNDVKDYEDCDSKIFENQKYRPQRWIDSDKTDVKDTKTVFFISKLKPTSEPFDLIDTHPPQGIVYREFD